MLMNCAAHDIDPTKRAVHAGTFAAWPLPVLFSPRFFDTKAGFRVRVLLMGLSVPLRLALTLGHEAVVDHLFERPRRRFGNRGIRQFCNEQDVIATAFVSLSKNFVDSAEMTGAFFKQQPTSIPRPFNPTTP